MMVFSGFRMSWNEHRILIYYPRQAVLVEHIHVRIRIELVGREYARLLPDAVDNERCTDHCRYARRVADSLAAEFLVALLMVADVIDEELLLFAVLAAREDTTDIGLAYSTRTTE